MDQPRKAIILSAGQGRRLMPLTASAPKCSVRVSGRPLLEWQLREIARCDIDEVVVVTGFAASVVDEMLKELGLGHLRVRTLYNPFYACSDNLGTCWVARSEMHQPFVIINGDTLFEAAILQRVLRASVQAPITLTANSKAHYDDDDMLIVAEGDRLRRVGKRLGIPEVNGESIGMLTFREDGAATFRVKLDEMMRGPNGLGSWYLSAIDSIARESWVSVCSITGLKWCEIDTRFDLAHAKNMVDQLSTDEPTRAERVTGKTTLGVVSD
jgi:L-glutamine-phosphate cytidylyltransferase